MDARPIGLQRRIAFGHPLHDRPRSRGVERPPASGPRPRVATAAAARNQGEGKRSKMPVNVHGEGASGYLHAQSSMLQA